MPEILAALHRRSKSVILAVTAAVLATVAALQLVHLGVARSRALSAAEARAENLAGVLSEYVQGSFAAADATLRQLTIHGRRLGGPSAPTELWTPLLEASQDTLPGGGSLTVTDASGIVRHSTLPQIVGQSRRDLYIFQRLSGSGIDEVVIRQAVSDGHRTHAVHPAARPAALHHPRRLLRHRRRHDAAQHVPGVLPHRGPGRSGRHLGVSSGRGRAVPRAIQQRLNQPGGKSQPRAAGGAARRGHRRHRWAPRTRRAHLYQRVRSQRETGAHRGGVARPGRRPGGLA